MAGSPANSLNISVAGCVQFDGNHTFTGGACTVANGGTGQVTLTNHGVLVGAGTSAITQLAAGSSGQVLQSRGASSDPSYSTATYPTTASGTGTILRADGTNWVASTATYPNTAGTSGNILTSDGTNWSSSAPTATSGNRVLLQTNTPAGVSTSNFNNLITSTYDVFEVEFYTITPSAGTPFFGMRIGTGATPTYDSGNNYQRSGISTVSSSATVSNNCSQNESLFYLAIPNTSTSTAINGKITLYNLNSTAYPKTFLANVTWFDSGSALEFEGCCGCWNTSGTAVTSLQFLFSANNIASGTIKLYGIVK